MRRMDMIDVGGVCDMSENDRYRRENGVEAIADAAFDVCGDHHPRYLCSFRHKLEMCSIACLISNGYYMCAYNGTASS